MHTQLIFLSLSLFVGVAPAKKSPKLVSTDVLFSVCSFLFTTIFMLIFSTLFLIALLIERGIGLVFKRGFTMSLLWQRESDMHFSANTPSVNGETMWSMLGGWCSPLGGGLNLLVTWASCNSSLMIYRKQRNQQVSILGASGIE